MSIDELAQSLLARQDKQREEDWERQRKARKRARREQLLGAAGGIAVNIGNRVLAQKSQDFMDREFDMASRAKYKQAISAGVDTQRLHGSIRDQGYTSSSAWKYDKLSEAAKAKFQATHGPNWDGNIPPEAQAAMRATSEAWGADFDSKYDESFKLQPFKEYQASVQRRFGRPASIEEWAIRGITNRTNSKTRQQGRAERAEALKAEIDNFDTDYKHLYDHTVQRTGNAAYAAQLVQDHANVSYRKFSTNKPVIKDGFVWSYSIDTDTGEEKLVRGERAPMGATVVGDSYSGYNVVWEDEDFQIQSKQVIGPTERPENTALTNQKRRDEVSVLFAEDDTYKGKAPDVQYELLRKNNERLFYDALNAGHKGLTNIHSRVYTANATKWFGGDAELRQDVQDNLIKVAKEHVTPAMAGAMEVAYEGDKAAIAKGLDMVATLSDPDYPILEDANTFYRMVAEDVVQARARNPKDASDNPIRTEVLIANAIAERSKGLVIQTGERSWLGRKKEMVVYADLYPPGSEASKRLENAQQRHNEKVGERSETMQELRGDDLTSFNEEFEGMVKNMTPEAIIEQIETMQEEAIKQNYKGFRLPVVAQKYYDNYKGQKKKEEGYVKKEADTIAAAQALDPDLTPEEALKKYPSVADRKSLRGEIQNEILNHRIRLKKFEDQEDFTSKKERWWKVMQARSEMDARELDEFKQSLEQPEEYYKVRDFALDIFAPYRGGIEDNQTYAQYFRDNPQDLTMARDLGYDMNAFITAKYLEYKKQGA